MFHFARSAKKIEDGLKFFKLLRFLKECTLYLHSTPKMSGAQSALFNFEMSGAQKSGALELVEFDFTNICLILKASTDLKKKSNPWSARLNKKKWLFMPLQFHKFFVNIHCEKNK